MNPLLLFPAFRRRTVQPRQQVPVPTEIASTSAIFLALRRMRAPLLSLVVIFTVSVVGLSLMPGYGADGTPRRMTLFEAFYVMSYTATTIGFGEIPYPYTTAQRLWVTAMIFTAVIGWAYAIGTMLSLVNDEAFRSAWSMQNLARQVRRVREPFHIVAGYGETGRSVCRRLDSLNRPFIVVDKDRRRVDHMEASELSSDIAAFTGDVSDPAVLGLAGLDHPDCAGVLALTNDDEANLAIVQTVAMLKPDVPVIARASGARAVDEMQPFGPSAIINPTDRFGNYLVLSLQRPAVYQLVVWLTSPRDGTLPPRGQCYDQGLWTVYAEGEFEAEVAKDLRGAGFEVRVSHPEDGLPDVSGAVGCVIATMKDARNIALAAQIRRDHPDTLLCVRQVLISSRPVLKAFAPHMLVLPTDLVARECLARVITPRTWDFLTYALEQDDVWANRVIELLRSRCGVRSPVPTLITLDERQAPALVHWLANRGFVVGDLTRDPDDRDLQLPLVVLSVFREDDVLHVPDPETELRPGDRLLVVSSHSGRGLLRDVLFNDAQVEYAATGRRVPQTWIWRRLTHSRT